MTLFKLGIYNIKHNFSKYFSYFVSTLFSVFMLFMFFSIYYNKQIQSFSNGRVKVYTIFKAASVIVIIFSALFIWYANGFFIKSRKKELALYSIVGMKKKEIGTLLFCESMFLGIMAIVIGVPLGVIASKYLIQLLVYIMKANASIHFTLDAKAVLTTIVIFMGLFLFNSYNAYKVVYKFKIIELLSAEKEAEKAPEGSKIMALISVIMILLGYIIAYTKTLEGGIQTVGYGFLAMLFIILGTYILFNNFIIILIKSLKRNKKFYYKGENLISISQLLYRIKANSNTLATVSVISAVAITAICFTVSLYMGSIRKIPALYSPINITYLNGDENLSRKVEAVINRHKEVKVTHKFDIAMVHGKALTPKYKGPFGKDMEAPFNAYIISKSQYNEILKYSECAKNNDDYNYVSNFKFTNDNQCFFIEVTRDNQRGRLKGENVSINIGSKKISLNIIDSDVKSVLGVIPIQRTTVVVSDSTYDKLCMTDKENISVIKGYSLNNYYKSGKLTAELKQLIPGDNYFNSSYDSFTETYSLFGSYVFIGLFLGILFVLSTGSILYYKQLTEAYTDKGRYGILIKVGARKKEIRHMVSRQLALIFGLPLIMAMLHSGVALAIYIKYMGPTKSLIGYVIIAAGLYTIIYLCYYILSVRSYMKIIYSKK